MKLSDFQKNLGTMESLNFVKSNGSFVPAHFHITEIGLVTKQFIDCGGEVHIEKLANIQIWVAQDFDHRLKPTGLLNIIDISKKVLGDEDLEIEIEYQTETIGKYSLEFESGNFVLVPKYTDCLAKANCGTPQPKQKLALSEIMETKDSCCTPGGGCC
jgi:hypothetical protein